MVQKEFQLICQIKILLQYKKSQDYIHAAAILKSPFFSAPEEFNYAKINTPLLKENKFAQNEAPFMTKDLRKAITKRSKLRNKFLKSRTLSDRKNYTSQRNLCKKLLKNTKRTYFNNLDLKKVTDNRTF